MKKTMLIRVAALLLMAALLLSFGGCAAGTLRPSSKANKAVAKSENIEILYDELYYLAKNKADLLIKEHGEDALSDPALCEELEEFVWENLLTREHAMISVGLDYGVRADRGEIADNVQTMIEQVIEENFDGDREAYADQLNKQYLTDRYFRTYYYALSFELLPTAIVKKMMEEKGDGKVTDEEALEIVEKDFIRTVQVVISKYNGRTDAENLAKATQIATQLAEIQDDAARYAAMKKEIGGEYNNDYVDTLGNGYYICRGQKKAAYEDAAFALDMYETSGVIEDEDAYCVIMRLPQDENYVKENLTALMDGVYLVKLNDAVDKRMEELEAGLEKTRFAESLDLCNLPEIDADGGKGVTVVIWALVAVAGCAGIIFVVRVLLGRRRVIKGSKKR